MLYLFYYDVKRFIYVQTNIKFHDWKWYITILTFLGRQRCHISRAARERTPSYLEFRYQRSVLTTHFDDIYIVICKSDGITDQPNHCRKHILYQILIFRTSSQTGIARRNTWCLIFRNNISEYTATGVYTNFVDIVLTF